MSKDVIVKDAGKKGKGLLPIEILKKAR